MTKKNSNMTELELHTYRSLTGLMLSYAENGDIENVLDIHNCIMNNITCIAERLIEEKTGRRVTLVWSTHAKVQYVNMVVDGIKAAEKGFEEWKQKQFKIEEWVEQYITMALVQGSEDLYTIK